MCTVDASSLSVCGFIIVCINCDVVLHSDSLYCICTLYTCVYHLMRYFCPDRSGLFQNPGVWGVTECFNIKMIFAVEQISTQDFGMRNEAPHYHHQTPNTGISGGRTALKLCWQHVAAQHLTFLFNRCKAAFNQSVLYKVYSEKKYYY